MQSAATAKSEAEGVQAGLSVASVRLIPLVEGALWWPDESTLVVADLHLEKGSSFARRGQMLPPYDTIATLKRLAAVMTLLAPARVIALGDSFHDRNGGDRLNGADRATLRAMTASAEWIWIAGNHDPDPPRELGGWATSELSIGPLTFRHEPRPGDQPGEIAGHLHPAARLVGRGRSIRRRCFAGDGKRLILPAFGALAGGLNVLDMAFRPLFDGRAFHAWMLGDTVHAIAGRRLVDG
ncbi:ligase-associated DNA damage response endonuclease PdeM [Kaistia terrae]|uniref:Ligase-associated DNA damage response endonuclease PdeM n=1 Tax=Kaistia terrae TaxID=537017 RepID=A0ABW0Q033_9HYPH|nr:ligase-associated DNA damage response endonuclease PdeM [Kaistia terrae]MCX5580324.1 ligase-associated DNA damage response endonuclease PdeM [Kaistia terrae]